MTTQCHCKCAFPNKLPFVELGNKFHCNTKNLIHARSFNTGFPQHTDPLEVEVNVNICKTGRMLTCYFPSHTEQAHRYVLHYTLNAGREVSSIWS